MLKRIVTVGIITFFEGKTYTFKVGTQDNKVIEIIDVFKGAEEYHERNTTVKILNFENHYGIAEYCILEARLATLEEIAKAQKPSAKARAEQELAELVSKINKLDDFLFDKATYLNDAEFYLMNKQYSIMCEYKNILEARLAIWRDIE